MPRVARRPSLADVATAESDDEEALEEATEDEADDITSEGSCDDSDNDAGAMDSDAGLVPIRAEEEDAAGAAGSSEEGEPADGGRPVTAAVGEEVDAPGVGGTLGKRRRTAARLPGQGRSQPCARDRLLDALLEFIRRVNACIARQGRDRVNGRFFGQDIRDAVRRLTAEEQDHLSDEDYVAVLEEVNGQKVVRLGIVEALLRSSTSARGKRSVESATRLAVDDPSGELVLRLLEPAGQDEETGLLRFFLPHHFLRNPNDRWTTGNLVQIVGVAAGPDRQDGSVVILDKESEEDLKAYCVANAWHLDDGELADTEGGAGSSRDKRRRNKKEKPARRTGAQTGLAAQRRPRQQKVQTRVPPDTLQTVDAAVGAPERKSAFGRRLKGAQNSDYVYS